MDDTYLALMNDGKFTAAERHVRKLFDACRQDSDSGKLEAAKYLAQMALAVEEQGRFAEAETLYKQVIAIRKAVLGEGTPDIAVALANLGQLLLKQGRVPEAVESLGAALASHDRDDTPDGDFVSSVLSTLVEVATHLRDFGSASTLIGMALKSCSSQSGPKQNAALSLALHNMGELCRQKGQLADATKLLSDSLQIREKLFGPDSEETLTTMATLAAVYNDEKRFDDAETLLMKVVRASERINVPDQVLAAAQNNLGFLCLGRGDRVAARRWLESALASCERSYGGGHPNTIGVRRLLAQMPLQSQRNTKGGCFGTVLLLLGIACGGVLAVAFVKCY
jgi:tetratricopeptide (TPR) repeat protein